MKEEEIFFFKKKKNVRNVTQLVFVMFVYCSSFF